MDRIACLTSLRWVHTPGQGTGPWNGAQADPNVGPRWSPIAHLPDSEDQRGFRIFDWYLAVSQRELGKQLPVFLLRAGSIPNDQHDPTSGEPDYLAHAEQNLTIARLLANETVEGCSPVPQEVKAGNFWLLAAHEKSVFSWTGLVQDRGREIAGCHKLLPFFSLPK